MRYALISKGLTIEQLKIEASKVGATDIKEQKLLRQVFCEMSDEQASTLSKLPGVSVKPVKAIHPDSILMPERTLAAPQQSISGDIWGAFSGIRSLFSPVITGQGLTVAVLDTGVRKTHESLLNKVVYEANFSGSPGVNDVFGHGTQVAFVIAGGEHGMEYVGVSPGASIMNIKVISDEGIATEEEVVDGIERVCELVVAAFEAGLPYTDPMYPNEINMSLGAEDDGDEDNPMRVASRLAVDEYGLDVVAPAGNTGPSMTTIMSPGTEPKVITVGAIETVYQVSVWEQSSRGPTKQGYVKPDFVFWGVDVEAADHRSDAGYLGKSGTSFSAPMLSGLTGLLWETGRRVYGENWLFRWIEARELAPYYCMKPDDVPAVKDNAYGYGLPAMGTMVGRLAGGPAGITDIMTPMMLMVMMMGMMKMMV